MKTQLLKVFLAVIIIMTVKNVFAQPTIRDGWPQDLAPAGMASFVEPNPLSVATLADGSRIIATGTNTHIRLFDIDGTLLHTWSTTDLTEGSLYLAGGPVIGDVDGDGQVEIVSALRSPNARTRAISVVELDGTINNILTHVYDLSTADISSVALVNVDGDEALEIVFYCGDLMHLLDNDGSEVTGFPWTISRGHAYGVPAVIPAEYNNGTPVIVWTSHDNNMHAQAIDATTELTGWPVAYNAAVGTSAPGPVLIPTETGWITSMVNENGLYAWNQDGNSLTGFPVTITNTDATMSSLGAADMDGDGSPDFIFRAWNSDYVQAVNLSGEYLTGYPYSTGSAGGRSETIAAIKMADNSEAMSFFGSLGPGVNDNHLHGNLGTTPMTGFPVDFVTTETVPFVFTAIFPPVDEVMSIVVSTMHGYTAVYDLTVQPTATATIEWAMPFGQSGGNRFYNPQPLAAVEGPLFAVLPITLDFGEVEVGTPDTLSITIQNNGLASGDITGIEITNATEDDFTSPDLTFPVTLGAGESVTKDVIWTPQTAGALNGNLAIIHTEDENGTTSDVAITGLAAQYPSLVFPDTAVEFGIVMDDNPVGSLSFDIQNDGAGEGVIDTILIATTHTDEITVSTTMPFTIAAGATVTVTLAWNPTTLGDMATSMQINHNDVANGGQQVVNITGSYQSDVSENNLPDEYFLAQNHPNPFNPVTSINFGLKEAGNVTIKVYNTNGQEVVTLAEGYKAAGSYRTQFNGQNLASGVYFYVLEVNNFRSLKKMLLIR